MTPKTVYSGLALGSVQPFW